MAAPTGPDELHTVTPYLVVGGVAKVIDFLKTVFNADEVERNCRTDGSIQHARVRIGDSIIMMGEPDRNSRPMPATLYVFVQDVDATYRRALAAGAKVVREPADQFYGDRNAGVSDASGNQWWIAQKKENLPPEEKARRAKIHRPPG